MTTNFTLTILKNVHNTTWGSRLLGFLYFVRYCLEYFRATIRNSDDGQTLRTQSFQVLYTNVRTLWDLQTWSIIRPTIMMKIYFNTLKFLTKCEKYILVLCGAFLSAFLQIFSDMLEYLTNVKKRTSFFHTVLSVARSIQCRYSVVHNVIIYIIVDMYLQY